MEHLESLYELCDTISDEIADANDKIRSSGGKLSAGDVDYIDKLTHTLKSLKTAIAMLEAEDNTYSSDDANTRYSANMDVSRASYARGRGQAVRRDRMGRYSRDDSGVRRMLTDAMEMATTDRERMAIRRALADV